MTKKIIFTAIVLIAAFSSLTLQAENIAAVQEVAPIYPKTALERKLTGWVVVQYEINTEGRAENIEVVSSEPARVFNRSATRAIRETKFEVSAAGSSSNQVKKFVFEIDEEIPGFLTSSR